MTRARLRTISRARNRTTAVRNKHNQIYTNNNLIIPNVSEPPSLINDVKFIKETPDPSRNLTYSDSLNESLSDDTCSEDTSETNYRTSINRSFESSEYSLETIDTDFALEDSRRKLEKAKAVGYGGAGAMIATDINASEIPIGETTQQYGQLVTEDNRLLSTLVGTPIKAGLSALDANDHIDNLTGLDIADQMGPNGELIAVGVVGGAALGAVMLNQYRKRRKNKNNNNN